MRTYVDVWQSSEGVDLLEVIRLMGNAGLRVIVGPHDFYFDWHHEAEFKEYMVKVHVGLKKSGIYYKTHTVSDEEAKEESVPEAVWVLPRV